eukprot:tig00021246_g19609.t1
MASFVVPCVPAATAAPVVLGVVPQVASSSPRVAAVLPTRPIARPGRSLARPSRSFFVGAHRTWHADGPARPAPEFGVVISALSNQGKGDAEESARSPFGADVDSLLARASSSLKLLAKTTDREIIDVENGLSKLWSTAARL